MCKYQTPKILLVDIDEKTTNKLIEKGFNIDTGTFGKKYKSKPGEECGLNGNLPFLTEKNIVVVDLKHKTGKVGDNPVYYEENSNADRTALFTPRGQNYFDPSIIFSYQKQKDFEKIIKNGGILIVFCDSLKEEVYYFKEYQGGIVYTHNNLSLNNYSWIPTNIRVNNCEKGKEIIINNNLGKKILTNYDDEIEYTCNFNIEFMNSAYPFFSNPIDEVIGYSESIENDDDLGFIFFLPKFKDKYIPIINMFEELLPELKPELFPEFVKNSWLDDNQYIFPEVKKIIDKKEEIISKHKDYIDEINRKIDNTRKEYKFMTNILIANGYGDFLEDNIYKVLEFIGYENIKKTDEIVEDNRQEDFRIVNENRFSLIEVKGHNGNPTEDDCQALLKYINRTMRKKGRTDIHGILIINHQKLLPPLERKKPAFTSEQISDAKRDGYTLVSTWELFKAVRLMQKEIINFTDVDKSLHQSGLFKAIPPTFKYLGKILLRVFI